MTTRITRGLLAAGIVGGAAFIIANWVQAFLRPGFDVQRDPLSLLLLGDLGWIQTINFIGTGILFVLFAIGLHGARTGIWGPRLVTGFGVGLIIAGAFHPDAALGFPPGTPAGSPTSLSWHNWLHTVGFILSFSSITAACFVAARRFRQLRMLAWARYSSTMGVVTPVLIVLGMAVMPVAGLAFAAAGTLAAAWVAALASKVLASRAQTPVRPRAEEPSTTLVQAAA
jgi:hypothetical protein